MARKDEEINEDEENEKPRPKKKSGVLKILLIVFFAILLVASSVGATLLLTGMLGHPEEDTVVAADDGAEDEAPPEAKTKSSKKSKDKKSAKGPKAPPIYVELGEPFVVNFVEGVQIRYLQVKIEAMTRDPVVANAVKTHLPQIRNNLVLMFSNLDYASLTTAEGKQKIRDQALVEIQNILKEETGNTGAEAVYFTSFVMQ
ncbi:MAG: flagellar basal body-associated FliL family protein [Gammaproteobacteria bacterium]|nr:flagellar basal body-associated FliL family protein [Gammaproteobacteria bacterium]